MTHLSVAMVLSFHVLMSCNHLWLHTTYGSEDKVRLARQQQGFHDASSKIRLAQPLASARNLGQLQCQPPACGFPNLWESLTYLRLNQNTIFPLHILNIGIRKAFRLSPADNCRRRTCSSRSTNPPPASLAHITASKKCTHYQPHIAV